MKDLKSDISTLPVHTILFLSVSPIVIPHPSFLFSSFLPQLPSFFPSFLASSLPILPSILPSFLPQLPSFFPSFLASSLLFFPSFVFFLDSFILCFQTRLFQICYPCSFIFIFSFSLLSCLSPFIFLCELYSTFFYLILLCNTYSPSTVQFSLINIIPFRSDVVLVWLWASHVQAQQTKKH